MRPKSVALLMMLALQVLPAGAEDEDHLELDTSRVSGNRELPRVMAIVPWKKAPPGEVPGRPAQSILDEALAPADRLVMRRQAAQWAALEAAREIGYRGPSGASRPESIEEE